MEKQSITRLATEITTKLATVSAMATRTNNVFPGLKDRLALAEEKENHAQSDMASKETEMHKVVRDLREQLRQCEEQVAVCEARLAELPPLIAKETDLATT